MTATKRPGFSEAAKTLNRVFQESDQRREETVTFSNHPLHDQLIDVFLQSSVARRQDDDSEPIDRNTIMIAKLLVESLPKAYQTPTISGEPDGHVNIEWFVHPRRILSVSVNPNGLLHWAALIGEEDPRGSCRFFGETPKTLLFWIARVCKG